ncbi:MAG: DUF6691 family protein [Rhodospirillaceae bacterium]
MNKNFAALAAGLLFGIGLAVSEMVNPTKVLGFLDITGNWDPSLAFVMGGALAVTVIAFRVILRQPHPVLDGEFRVPTSRDIDGRLMGGAALFGIGWGMIGLCPGPAIASLAYGRTESVVFLIAMFIGLYTDRLIRRQSTII